MGDNFWVDYLTPDELELKLLSLPKLTPFQESKSEQHAIEIADFREPLSTVPEVTHPRRTKMRSKRMKRGKSLEREIAKLILSESNLEAHPVGGLSPREILSDLISSQENSLNTSDHSAFVGSNEIIESKNSQVACIDDSTTAGQFAVDNVSALHPGELHPKASSDSDAFDFITNSNEWAEFDGQSIFGVGCKQPMELDDDGFPARHEELVDENISSEITTVAFNADSKAAGLSVEVHKDQDENAEETAGETQFACVMSCDKQEPTVPILPGGFTVNFRNFESELSPSSVAQFHSGLPRTGHQTGQPYAFKCQTSTISKSPWSPKPPVHYKHSNIVLSQPVDTLV